MEEGVVERFKSRGTFVASGKVQDIGLLWPSGLTNRLAGSYPAALLRVIERAALRVFAIQRIAVVEAVVDFDVILVIDQLSK